MKGIENYELGDGLSVGLKSFSGEFLFKYESIEQEKIQISNTN